MNASFQAVTGAPDVRPRFFEIPEIVEQLPLSKDGVYREIHAGNLAAIRIGGAHGGKYIVPARLLDLMDAQMRGVGFDTTVSELSGRFLSIAEAASILRISRPVLAKRARGHEFPAARYGGKHIIAGAVIDDMETKALHAMTLIRTDDYVACVRQTAMEVAA
ncbi:helix-turn-helix domain-containing protein [Stackebrandtia nassauensis]|uniref:Helix-turn-helix domain-containing protein n=1 Tax=Stackebrandtia nassauensis (strain DSM 44728 / CIP 108903 / NRRL B-16338 / NBRC 102104 / LLR-40K-21) TaxID=446470 RepID=D3Q2W7_STANL|nr:helix-turn-helix domain-containing protein [Stackebrandtia nassauensis]ADD45868.1 hypothetical protein Snas_6248 [Stackebrandtia nassauensis DSM 44728]